MDIVTFGGQPVKLSGDLPPIGRPLPDFTLVGQSLKDITARDFRGQRLVLNIFPSLDTTTCAISVRQFNQRVSHWPNTVVLCVSKDLPFAQGRFCSTEGLEHVVTASAFRSSFGDDYGLTMIDGPLRSLLARAVIVADETGTVLYHEVVPVIEQEPNYEEAAAAVLG